MRFFLLNIPVLLLLAMLMGGCAGMSLEIRNDPSPSPLDVNYHTVLMQTTCSSGYSMGQAGCSFEEGQDLSTQSLSILSPLGGKVSIISSNCGVDQSTYLKQGEVVTYKISDIMPPGISFCTYNIFTHWEKPPEIHTEVPVRGQSGKFYLRIRPKGSKPSNLYWKPDQGTLTPESEKNYSGIIYAQFREMAKSEMLREPILLKIRPSKPVDVGVYTLWSEAKQIGVKSAPYSGDWISIKRETILGPTKKGSYILGGYALSGTSGLDDDFYAAIDIFGYTLPKLSGTLSFTDKEVCYETESTVSLVLISNVEKASNKTKACFPKPPNDAVMAFYTNVGRAAYAFIQGDSYKWIQ